MRPIYSTTIKTRNQEIKVHAISTGQVKVKSKFRQATKKGMFAKLDFILRSEFTEWLPIWVWVIEHPEGLIIVDTGINDQITQKNYFKSTGLLNNWVNTTLFQYEISPEETIDNQLKQLGLNADNVSKVVMTHMHIDHFDGLKYFPNAEIIINKYDWNNNKEALPSLYPEWLAPNLVDLNQSYGAFPKAYAVTQAKDLYLVATPGHTVGHCSVILQGDAWDLFFAGDVTYHLSQLEEDEISGAIQDYRANAETYQNIKAQNQKKSLIYLPSHDKKAGERLQKGIAMEGMVFREVLSVEM